jgi:hypothetical protein
MTVNHTQGVFLTKFIRHSTSNPKCHVMFSKNKNERQSTSTFSSSMSPRCHMPRSTRHFNFRVSIDVWFFLLHKSHYMSNFKSCESMDVQCIFEQSLCVSNVKNLQKLCPTYTVTTLPTTPIATWCEQTP